MLLCAAAVCWTPAWLLADYCLCCTPATVPAELSASACCSLILLFCDCVCRLHAPLLLPTRSLPVPRCSPPAARCRCSCLCASTTLGLCAQACRACGRHPRFAARRRRDRDATRRLCPLVAVANAAFVFILGLAFLDWTDHISPVVAPPVCVCARCALLWVIWTFGGSWYFWLKCLCAAGGGPTPAVGARRHMWRACQRAALSSAYDYCQLLSRAGCLAPTRVLF